MDFDTAEDLAKEVSMDIIVSLLKENSLNTDGELLDCTQRLF